MIDDRVLVAAEIKALVTRCGSQVAAARRAGIAQGTLSKLLCQRIGWVREETRARLLALVPHSRRNAFGLAFLSSDAMSALRANHAWFQHWGERLVQEVWLVDRVDSSNAALRERRPWWSARRSVELLRLFRRMSRLCRRELTAFVKGAHRLGHCDEEAKSHRVILAFWRILEPLVESREAGFIERCGSEIGDAELRRFVVCGLQRERILLRREPDALRSQKVAALYRQELARQVSLVAEDLSVDDPSSYADESRFVSEDSPAWARYDVLEREGGRLIWTLAREAGILKQFGSDMSDARLLEEFSRQPTVADAERFLNRVPKARAAKLEPYLVARRERDAERRRDASRATSGRAPRILLDSAP